LLTLQAFAVPKAGAAPETRCSLRSRGLGLISAYRFPSFE
jgi:hypothetical protein